MASIFNIDSLSTLKHKKCVIFPFINFCSASRTYQTKVKLLCAVSVVNDPENQKKFSFYMAH